MPETWGLGQVVAFVRETSEENPRFGRALVLFGLLSFVGGVAILVQLETFRMPPEEIWTYRRAAAAFAGAGLPAFFYGLVVLSESDEQITDVSGTGVLLCVLALFLFLVTSPGAWNGSGASVFVFGTVVVYMLGGMTCAFAAGVAMTSDASDDERGLVRGNPPEG